MEFGCFGTLDYGVKQKKRERNDALILIFSHLYDLQLRSDLLTRATTQSRLLLLQAKFIQNVMADIRLGLPLRAGWNEYHRKQILCIERIHLLGFATKKVINVEN